MITIGKRHQSGKHSDQSDQSFFVHLLIPGISFLSPYSMTRRAILVSVVVLTVRNPTFRSIHIQTRRQAGHGADNLVILA